MAAKRRRRRERLAGALAKRLTRVARLFRAEIEGRRWGKSEFDGLLAESKAAGEASDPAEREAVRRALSAIERLSSLHVGSEAAVEVLKGAKADAVSLAVANEIVGAFRDQAGRAAGDAFAALVASSLPVVRRPSRSGAFKGEAARLASLRPSARDLKASVAAISAVAAARPGRSRSAGPLTLSLADVVGAAAFVDRAVGKVERLIASAGMEDKSFAASALRGLFTFLARSASFGHHVATLRLASIGESR